MKQATISFLSELKVMKKRENELLVVVSSVLMLAQTKWEKDFLLHVNHCLITDLTQVSCVLFFELVELCAGSDVCSTYQGHCQRNWMYSMSALQVMDLL